MPTIHSIHGMWYSGAINSFTVCSVHACPSILLSCCGLCQKTKHQTYYPVFLSLIVLSFEFSRTKHRNRILFGLFSPRLNSHWCILCCSLCTLSSTWCTSCVLSQFVIIFWLTVYLLGFNTSHVKDIRHTWSKIQQEGYRGSSENGRRHCMIFFVFFFLFFAIIALMLLVEN